MSRFNQQTNWICRVANSAGLFAIVLCLLLSQTLGFMHGIEHAPNVPRLNLQRNTLSEAAATDVRASWIVNLFSGHSEESTCQVFDQLSHGKALLGHASDIAQLTLASFFLDTYRGATPPYQRSLIQARGPPAASNLV